MFNGRHRTTTLTHSPVDMASCQSLITAQSLAPFAVMMLCYAKVLTKAVHPRDQHFVCAHALTTFNALVAHSVCTLATSFLYRRSLTRASGHNTVTRCAACALKSECARLTQNGNVTKICANILAHFCSLMHVAVWIVAVECATFVRASDQCGGSSECSFLLSPDPVALTTRVFEWR